MKASNLAGSLATRRVTKGETTEKTQDNSRTVLRWPELPIGDMPASRPTQAASATSRVTAARIPATHPSSCGRRRIARDFAGSKAPAENTAGQRAAAGGRGSGWQE